MNTKYRNQSERFAFFMVIEGVAILVVVALFAKDARMQRLMFGREATKSTKQTAYVESVKSERVHVESNANYLSVSNQEEQSLLEMDGPDHAASNFATPEMDLNSGTIHGEVVAVESDSDRASGNGEWGASNDLINDSLELSAPPAEDADLSRDFSTDVNDLPMDLPQQDKGLDDFEGSGGEVELNPQGQELAVSPMDDLDSIQPNDQLPLPTIPVENPVWWMLEFNQPLLKERIPLRATLDEVVFVALRNSPQLTILNTRPAIQETFVGEESAAFDWATFAETRWNELDEPIGSDLTTGFPGRFVQRQWTYESGLKKRLFNGGEIKFGQQYGTLDNNSTFLVPPDQGSSQFTIDYRQPLLRGAGKAFNTSQVLLADLNFDATSSRTIEETQRFIVDVIASYWDMYLARVRLIQTRRSVARAEELLRQLRERFGIDVSNDQLSRAESAVALRKSDVIRAEFDLVNAQDILNNLAMGPEATNATHVELIPDSLNLPSTIQMSEERLVEIAIRNRPEIREAIARTKSAEVRELVANNSMLPKLDAIIQTYVRGLRGNKDISGAFNDQFTNGDPSYSVGLTYELPIGNRAAKNRVQRSELQSRLIQSEFRKTMGDVILDVRVAAREVARLNQEIENNYDALQKAAQELRLIGQRQKMGLDDNRTGSLYIEDLLASQARLSAAEQRIVIAQREQAVGLIDLKRATGEFLQTAGSVDAVSNMCAVPLVAAPFVPPVVHQISDAREPNENDFRPTLTGIKSSFNDANVGTLEVNASGRTNASVETTQRRVLVNLPVNNEFNPSAVK